MLFPRLSVYGNMILGIGSLELFIENNNGVRTCAISIYAFDRIFNDKPYIQSAVIDLIYCKAEKSKGIDYLKKLEELNVRYTAFYDGKDFTIMCPLSDITDYHTMKHDIIPKTIEKTNIPFTSKVIGFVTWHRTFNTRSKKYCVKVFGNDKTNMLDIIASKPTSRTSDYKGEYYINEI